MNDRQSFLQGTLVLLAANLFNRVLGFVYQIFLIRLIMPEGLGLINMVYPIYVLVLVLATAGIPVAISKLVAEEMAVHNLRGAYRIFKLCFLIMIVNSIIFSALCFLGAPFLLEHVFPNPRVHIIFLSLLPGIIIVSVCSAFRGYFQGLQQMSPTALTQALEQTVRVVCGLTLASLLLPRGLEYAAAGASLGVVAGELAGLSLMLLIYRKKRPPMAGVAATFPDEPAVRSALRIFNLAVPVTLTRFGSTALMSIDAVLIPLRLQAGGLNLNEATSTFGQFVGISQSLLFTPGIITISMATALIPAVSDALALHRSKLVRSRCEEAVRITLLAGLPCAAILFLLSEELCGLIFGYPEAGGALKILALGGPFLYLQQTTTGILQGLGQAYRPFYNLILASIFKITCIYYLTALPQFSIRGTAAALVVGFVLMAWLNLADLRRLTGFRIEDSSYLPKALLATAGMGLLLIYFQHFVYSWTQSELQATFSAILAGLSGYIFLLILSGGIKGTDLQRLARTLSPNSRL